MDISQIKREIGLRIRAFRTQNKWTQEKFSEIIELQPANLSDIEKGKKHPGFGTLCSMISNGGIEPNYLFDFLRKNKNTFSSKDLDIMNLIINLSDKQKDTLVALLSNFK